ncbi:MAG: zinc metalloprotease HtpX [Gemmatimonadota bacterium]|jgi:heat shock protein HtpX|nr:zinc metalloprotease HtpX [Gemmatimonadota bacterium]
MNTLKVFVLLAGLTALFGAVGGAIGGQSGALVALGLAAVMNVVMYYGSSTMVLRAYRAQVVDASQAPGLYAMVDRLRQRAGLPMPVVAIAPHEQPNAFATGRNPEHGVVCVTEGLLRIMSTPELEGVIAHELAHIKNRDMLLMTIAATIAGAISNLSQFGFLLGGRSDDGESNPMAGLLMMILGPLAAMLLQSAISRTREFKADAVGAEIAGSPEGLASALRTLERAAQRIPMQVSPAAASMAIVNPLSAFKGQALVKLFSTHPPTEARVEALARLR